MEPIRCFFVTETGQATISLRRYRSGSSCAANDHGYCNAVVMIGEGALVRDGRYIAALPQPPRDDPRWPRACACGYAFADADDWHISQHPVYRREDTGGLIYEPPHRFPAGALWYADWRLPPAAGPDGHCLMCMTPGGEWAIDSRASNCTLPDDNIHKCWVRHGEVPNITVDKQGNTCAAGAGSIMAGSYHGFLTDGFLVG